MSMLDQITMARLELLDLIEELTQAATSLREAANSIGEGNAAWATNSIDDAHEILEESRGTHARLTEHVGRILTILEEQKP